MKIFETRTFTFSFPFLGMSEMTCHVPANSKDEAVEKLREWFEKTISEFAMEFPRIKPVILNTTEETPSQTGKLNMMQKDFLTNILQECGLHAFPTETIDEAVERISALQATSENFGAIKIFFEQIKNGVKKVDSSSSTGETITALDQNPKKKK